MRSELDLDLFFTAPAKKGGSTTLLGMLRQNVLRLPIPESCFVMFGFLRRTASELFFFCSSLCLTFELGVHCGSLMEGSVSRDFSPILYDSNPSGSLTQSLKHFIFLFRFRRDIGFFKLLDIPPWSHARGVHPTANQAPLSVSHRVVKIEAFVSFWLLLKGQSGEIQE